MQGKPIRSLTHYLNLIEHETQHGSPILLFRGQCDDKPLLPSICRDTPTIDTTELEEDMLYDFERRIELKVKTSFKDKWDCLVYAQHFGMHTRLLDWTSNPLIALWFACSNGYKLKVKSFVYVLSGTEDLLLNRAKELSPFGQANTRILKPALNNERIVAQAGWFTSHKYSQSAGKFVALESNPDIMNNIFKIVVPAKLKTDILKSLATLGVNHQTLFPDIEGVGKHLNWKYLSKL